MTGLRMTESTLGARTTFEALTLFGGRWSIVIAIGSLAGNVSQSASSSMSSKWETADSEDSAAFSLLKIIILSVGASRAAKRHSRGRPFSANSKS
jgi:hypothetical protein